MGLFLLLTWVVFTLFGVALTLKVEKNFRYGITPFLGLFLIKVIPLKLFYYQTFFETWHNQHS